MGSKPYAKPITITGPAGGPRPVDTAAELFYAELADGRKFGEDIGGVVARSRADWFAVHSEKQRLLGIYRENGEAALAAALAAESPAGEAPSTVAARRALLRLYKGDGISAVVRSLSEPDLKGPLVKLALK